MKVFKSLLKTFFAGVTALAILSVLILGYYYMPLRVNNKNNNTDYVWTANTPWASLTEGISYGMTDSNGYINKEVVKDPDIIVLGSSHIQAMNVMPGEDTCTLLNGKFNGSHKVYNMGISGHTFYKVIQYIRKSLDIFGQTPKYTIIETDTVALKKADVQMSLSGKVSKTLVIDKGIISDIQRIPYFRHIYHQFEGGLIDRLLPKKKAVSNNTDVTSKNAISAETKIDEKPYEELLSYLQTVEKDYKTNIVVIFHPTEALQGDGSISFFDGENARVFSRYAEKHQIGFIDMTEDFEKMYYEEHQLPHGFSTGKLGEGHINKYGHSAMAERLYKYIQAAEGK